MVDSEFIQEFDGEHGMVLVDLRLVRCVSQAANGLGLLVYGEYPFLVKTDYEDFKRRWLKVRG